MITGFAFTNPQHMVNGPVYGLDNWIHLAHEGPAQAVIYQDVFGDRGTPLRWPGHPHRPAVTVDRRGVRLRPDAGLLEATSAARRSTATASTRGAATSPPRTPTMRGTR